jgi:zinc protease
MRLRLRFGLLCFVALTAAAADRSHPPTAGPPRPLKLPPARRLTLRNGLRVVLVESHAVPVAEVYIALQAGATADPLDRTGLAAMTADMLDEGAAGKDTLALSESLELLGAELATGSNWDAATVRLHVPVARLKEALPLLADVIVRPDFPPAELARMKRDMLTALLQARDEPNEIAYRALAQAVFPGHRYGLPERGDARSITAIGVDEVRAFHARLYRPSNAVLVVVGDVDAGIVPALESTLGAWPAATAASPSLAPPQQLKSRVLWLVDRPAAAQSVLRAGRVGPPRATADYHALEVLNTLLGGSFTSRLNDNLREQHGYAYTASSGFLYHRIAGEFLAGANVQTQSTAQAVAEVVKELDRIHTPAPSDEVERARSYLAYGYAFDFDTTREIAGRIAGQVIYGLPDDTFETYVPKVLAVGPKDLQRAARSHIDSAQTAFVIVGDRAQVEAPLRALRLAPVSVKTLDDVMGPPPRIE